jgi:RNA polymerase sigma-70 factor (ECF subfamily)
MSEQPAIDWKSVVDLIERRDPAGEEILYKTLETGARLFLQRRLGAQDVEDRVHDIFLTVVDTIRRGEIKQPERLMGFVRTVLHRQLSRGVQNNIRSRESEMDIGDVAHQQAEDLTPEEQAIQSQKTELMKKVLRRMSDRDFEVLSRFYLREQPPDRICREMGLTRVQFQLLKSRAKARMVELMRQKFAEPPTSPR